MDSSSLFHKFYIYSSQATNSPKLFLSTIRELRKLQPLPVHAINLLEIKARILLGDMKQAGLLLEQARISPESALQSFYQAQLDLLEIMLISASSSSTDRIPEILSSAEQHLKQCGSKALECEILVAKANANPTEMDLTFFEDSLKQAVQLALDNDLPDLMISASLALIQVYQSHQLPNLAEREIQMLRSMIDKQQHRYRLTHLLNQSAINQMMLKNYPSAELLLREAINEANDHGFRIMASSLYLNLGICKMRMKELDESLIFYDTALEVLKTINCEHSNLAAKISGNKANCLALMGDLANAAATIRTTMQDYQSSGNELQYHTHAVNLADVLIELEDFTEAEKLLDKAIEYFAGISNHGYLQNAHLCKARLYEVQQRYQEAFGSMEELYQASQQYFRENFAKQNHRFQHRIEEMRTQYQLLKSCCAEQEPGKPNRSTHNLIGEHPSLKKALSEAMLAARHPYANVIIQGESGTGKEVLARIIHFANSAEKPLVAINAAAISPNLIESELFGHVKGAFTGAVSDYKGKFLMANGGTLFLDEISEMPLEVQTKLLRAIEYQTITPVGSNKEYAVKCRIVCATNVRLKTLIHSNKFRLDLYHRLNKVEIILPALRERISDLEILTRYFVQNIAREQGMPVPEITGSFYDRLSGYSFPGNIRELRNIIERIFILRFRPFWDAKVLDGLLLDEQDTHQNSASPMAENLEKVQYSLILNALNQCNWMQKEAARILKISESTLTRRMQKLGISRSNRSI